MPGKALETARKTGHFLGEGWRVRKNGSRFWASTVLTAIRNPAGDLIGFAKITRDITERMEAQSALLDSESRFRRLVEGVIDYAIYMLDPSGIVTNWNPGAQRMKGYSAQEAVGQHFSRFYTEQDRAAGLPARVLAAAAREGHFEAEGWRVRKDGSHFWASVVVDAIRGDHGELLGFAKITRDITERQKAQEALRDSERQFRLLIAGVTDYALYMLDPNGLITSWNAGAEKIKGYTADEIIGQHFSKFYTQADRAAGLPARSLHTAETTGRFESENWRVRKDGTLFWANVVIDAIHDERGRLVGFAKITRDMTEKRNAQLALEQAQIRRAQAQKFEALGQLTSGVAHDFNNLLMIVSGYLGTLKKLAGEDPRGQRAIQALESVTSRGQSLTRQLLAFARRQPLSPVLTTVEERLSAVNQLLTASVGGGVQIVHGVRNDIWPIRVDINELELALVNLGINARDAMPNGGVITVTAENVSLSGPDNPEHLVGDYVRLTIADTGCGIPADILPRVFEPFFTTKEVGKGSGLGLAQVHGFAHQSGGAITVESEVGNGTRITLYLPRATTAEAATDKATELQSQASGGRLLLVEDNPEVAEATTSMLLQLGYEVTHAASAKAALAATKDQQFDLVISDIVMAGEMNGLDFARRLRELHPDLPVMLVTGYSDIAESAAREFTLMRKPYRASEIGRAAANLVAQARGGRPDNLVKLQDVRQANRDRSR